MLVIVGQLSHQKQKIEGYLSNLLQLYWTGPSKLLTWCWRQHTCGNMDYLGSLLMVFCIPIQVYGNTKPTWSRSNGGQEVNCWTNATINKFWMIPKASQTDVKLMSLPPAQRLLTKGLSLLHEGQLFFTGRIHSALGSWHFHHSLRLCQHIILVLVMESWIILPLR